MECNKDEAIRAKTIAENKMTNNDFEGARKIALKAQKLFPELDNISQLLTVCDVHCSAKKKINNTEMDLYGILQVENLADEVTIKKQYRKLALALHPDKNKFPGAESAFKLICEANRILSDKGQRYLYDFKCKATANPGIQKPQYHNGSQNPMNFADQKSKSDTNGRSPFLIHCSFCKKTYCYDQALKNRQTWCPNCLRLVMGVDTCAQQSTKPPPNRGSAGSCGSNQGPDMVRPGQQEVGKSSKRTRVDDEKSPEKKPKVSSSGVQKDKIEGKNNNSESNSDLKDDGEAVYIDCKEPEFANFDKEKEKDCFEVDQIWACYDPIDGMPRFYAQIRKVYKAGFRVRITWLEANPDNPPEILWADEGLPVSCGKFIRGETEETRDRLMFSHRMTFYNGTKKFSYMIYPKKGEIWALFKDWDINWSFNPKTHLKYKFEIVVVLSDFENDSGVLVSSMVKVKGFVGLFQSELAGWKIPPNELFRFSHRVPSAILTGMERADVPVGSFELDTASLPDDLSEFYSSNEPLKTPESSSCFHDFESDKKTWKFMMGEIWGIQISKDQNRKCYAQIKKIESSPLRLYVDLLELCIFNDMSRPNACGLYKASTDGRRIFSRDSFLFLVEAEVNGKNRFNIYPNEKEIWVLYSEQDSKCAFGEYEVVEVVEKNGDMIKVLCLSLVGGYKSVFKASEIESVKSRVLEIPCAEFNRFCYRVPAVLLTDKEGGQLKGCWELDLAHVSGLLPS